MCWTVSGIEAGSWWRCSRVGWWGEKRQGPGLCCLTESQAHHVLSGPPSTSLSSTSPAATDFQEGEEHIPKQFQKQAFLFVKH